MYQSPPLVFDLSLFETITASTRAADPFRRWFGSRTVYRAPSVTVAAWGRSSRRGSTRRCCRRHSCSAPGHRPCAPCTALATAPRTCAKSSVRHSRQCGATRTSLPGIMRILQVYFYRRWDIFELHLVLDYSYTENNEYYHRFLTNLYFVLVGDINRCVESFNRIKFYKLISKMIQYSERPDLRLHLANLFYQTWKQTNLNISKSYNYVFLVNSKQYIFKRNEIIGH